jgi:hypothetical protein
MQIICPKVLLVLLLLAGLLDGPYAGATEPQPIKPNKVVTEAEYKIQWFTLRPGELILSDRGGSLRLIELRKSELVAKRTYQGIWKIGGEYNFGNHELLEITAIDLDKQTATVRLKSRIKFHVWDAFSF